MYRFLNITNSSLLITKFQVFHPFFIRSKNQKRVVSVNQFKAILMDIFKIGKNIII